MRMVGSRMALRMKGAQRCAVRGAVALAASCLMAGALAGCSSGAAGEGGSEAAPSGGQQTMAQQLYGSMSDFTASTMDGGTFTNDDLVGYDLTMVNVWQTNCHYCIEEMPAIELLYQSLPDNMNLITICLDGEFNIQLAEQILGESGATFTTLNNSESLSSGFTGNLTGVPTTIFVDSGGNIVGQPQVGMPTEGSDEAIAQRYRDLMDDCLEKIG